MKEHKGIIVGAILLIIIFSGMFVFAYIQKLEFADHKDTAASKGDKYSHINVDSIEASRYFSDGTHTLVGEIELPTPCDLLNWEIMIAESYPEQVTIDFFVENHSDECVQVITNQQFQVIFDASKDASIRTRFEGKSTNFTLKEVGTDENIDGFTPLGTR